MTDSDSSDAPEYDEPKIMLVDMDEETAELLVEEGFNTSIASLGRPYKVDQEAAYYPVEKSVSLPYDHKEHDIVVIDTDFELQKGRGDEGKSLARGVKDWWVSHHYGYVNPRCLYGPKVQNDFDRILNSGGVFVVFAGAVFQQEFRWGAKEGSFNDLYGEDPISVSNWSFLNILSQISTSNDHGSVVRISDDVGRKSPLGSLLSSYSEEAFFECAISPKYKVKEKWVGLLENKFGRTIGAVILPDKDKGREGFIFVFPQIQSKGEFTAELIKEVLPAIVPQLFPEFENESWISRPEYELSAIKSLEGQIVEVREEAEKKIQELEHQIERKREEKSYLFDLLTESGDNLVYAVIETLRKLGFSEVVDVDEVVKEEGGEKREDIQIWGNSPALIGEVKGISYYPSDEDALTVQKYVTLRMREWDRTDVQGLAVINHQRNMPPLERDNDMPFRQEILDSAEEQEIGLITTWDLHRLTRSYLRHGWKHQNVNPLFYQIGRIDPIPSHYEYVGELQGYIKVDGVNVAGVEVENAFEKGDRLAFELPSFFEEQLCESMELENEPIDLAEPGMYVGVETHLSKEQAQPGMRVFRVFRDDDRLDDEPEAEAEEVAA